jgi:hypothetical protein
LKILLNLVPPSIQRKNRDLVFVGNKPLRIDYDVNGSPELKPEWFFNDLIILNQDRILFEQKGNKFSLVIQSAQENDAGAYTFKVANEVGVEQAVTNVIVEGISLLLFLIKSELFKKHFVKSTSDGHSSS